MNSNILDKTSKQNIGILQHVLHVSWLHSENDISNIPKCKTLKMGRITFVKRTRTVWMSWFFLRQDVFSLLFISSSTLFKSLAICIKNYFKIVLLFYKWHIGKSDHPKDLNLIQQIVLISIQFICIQFNNTHVFIIELNFANLSLSLEPSTT